MKRRFNCKNEYFNDSKSMMNANKNNIMIMFDIRTTKIKMNYTIIARKQEIKEKRKK